MANRSKEGPPERLERVLETLKTRVPIRLTDDEVTLLEPEAGNFALASKLLALHHVNAANLEQARAHMLEAFRLAPAGDTAKNLIVVLGRLGRFAEALAFTEEHAATFDPIELQDALCWINWRIGRYDRSRAHGLQALALKDAESRQRSSEGHTPQRVQNGDEGTRVVSFSLFGDAARYLDGAIRNCLVARYLYPGWVPRFYVDDSVPAQTLEALEAEGATIERVRDPELAPLGTFWRFLVEDDTSVALYLVRDCDAVINIKERAAVEDWLASPQPFHVMRDHPTHAELMLAGMWGARRGRLGPMRARILDYTSAAGPAANDRHLDQKFLRHEIWPRVKREALVHDDWFAFGDAQPFRPEFGLPHDRHIGQNDALWRSTGDTHESREE